MHNPAPSDARRSVARELSRYFFELQGAEERDPEPFSLARALREMTTERGLHDGREREVSASTALLGGGHHDPHRIAVPFGAIATRDLSAGGGGSAGGYLVSGTEAAQPFDVLRTWSVVASAGVQVLPNLRGNVVLPRTTTASSAGWIGTEATQASASQPTLGSISLTPKTVGVVVNISRHLLLQAGPSVETLLRQNLLGAIGAAVDAAFFAGTGASGQPLGLVNTAGIGTQSGTTLALAAILNMRETVLTAGGREANLQWVGTPAVQELLGARERVAAGGRHLWDDAGILGRPASATTTAPASTLICGDFSTAVVGIWGPGAAVVEVNPFASFQAGVVQARALLTIDFGFPTPSAFCVATSIT